ncbi:hypothetical protein CPIN17261_0884 [Campylobacter pinnipediorum subsp. pinnipediorum]|uniref:Uncharacterized protein n=1 Tax=Campylobacter pinnipediorum subsp. pinnipediorum TaxID=1660067 RepID=A0AAX0L9C8_9BACT|nr:hypothetical protein [Campylobacter pinnipediorum]AQW82894.1 hypothetical protein CPIN17261_0884 [Campylobacter pinnipediorum subsp. pinnipediorum]OPA77236.1 hypothetical protein BFG04_03835 [Campylobacter pinnipediorum subsp. pinnipediorum]
MFDKLILQSPTAPPSFKQSKGSFISICLYPFKLIVANAPTNFTPKKAVFKATKAPTPSPITFISDSLFCANSLIFLIKELTTSRALFT